MFEVTLKALYLCASCSKLVATSLGFSAIRAEVSQ